MYRNATMTLGNSVETEQWESGNLSTRFPFEDDSGPEGYPFDAIVDACIVVPSESEPSSDKVHVGCLHISSSMVSVMIYVGGRPALHCKVTRSRFEPFSSVQLESIYGNCSGFISFGDIRFESFSRPVVLRSMVPVSESAVVRPVVGRLRKFIQPARGEEASGIVGVVVPEGVSMSVDPEEGHTSTVRFSLGGQALSNVLVSCDKSEPVPGSLMPVQTINGMPPDANGRIAIVFAKSKEDVPE